uniref:uS12 prolyl 3-hydroxylase n=1 Tax=Pristionchus pacificus TaxID=54126 RepID=A0A8R1YGC9_PRIPA
MVKRSRDKRKDESMEIKRSFVLTSFHINSKILEEDACTAIRQMLSKGDPFPHVHLDNFVGDGNRAIHQLEKELLTMDWRRRENDLYTLSQTVDLKSLKATQAPFLYSFRRFLTTSVRSWLSETTGVELTSQVDSTGSVYTNHDGLLPHSDLIGTRHFAFVYYLTDKEWEEEDGGYLQLYSANDNHEPVEVVKSLKPKRNSFILFEVSADSWHRVAEVLTDRYRLSINGWFHSTRKLDPPPINIRTIQRFSPTSMDVDLSDLVVDQYQKPDMVAQVKMFFNDESEVMINDFVEESLNASVLQSLNKTKFSPVGPPSKRNLMRAERSSLKGAAASLYSILSSSSFALYLTHLTSIDLDETQLSLQVYRLECGSYSISGDEELEESTKDGHCLDCNIFIGGEGWDESAGGVIVYAGKGDTQELIRLQPSGRSLALVLREPDVYSFLKYANSSASSPIYSFSLTYYNVPMEDAEEANDS